MTFAKMWSRMGQSGQESRIVRLATRMGVPMLGSKVPMVVGVIMYRVTDDQIFQRDISQSLGKKDKRGERKSYVESTRSMINQASSGTVVLQSSPIEQKRVNRCKMPSYIDSIRVMLLTPHGKAKLCAYPEEAIEDAVRNLKMSKKINMKLTNPFATFIGIANGYCRSNNIEPNYAFVERYITQEKIDKSSPFIKPKVGNMYRPEEKPMSQRVWVKDYSLPTSKDFDHEELAKHFATDTWKKLERSSLATELHGFLMVAMEAAERRTKGKR